MPLILGANSVSGYSIKNSLRFNSGSSDYLNRTPSSATNRNTWTWSAWVKRSILSSYQVLFEAKQDANNDTGIWFLNDNTLKFFNNVAGVTHYITTSQVFRDVSAWYHIVAVWDTTNATASDRIKLYVNGTQITNFSASSNASLNENSTINNTQVHTIGRVDTVYYYDGYVSEINFIDGQALTPSSFGETDTLSGIWIPKAYTGTYGTNGFYLKFANSASLGTDSSGNGNNFTVNNLTSVDQSTDTPTNNFCTLNPLVQAGSVTSGATYTYSNGNITITASGNKWVAPYGSIGLTMGKWYYEMKLTTFASPTGSPVRVGWGALDDVVKDNEVYFRGLT